MSSSPISAVELDIQTQEWEIRYRKLEELVVEKEKTSNDNNAADEDFISRSMIVTAGRLGTLQLQTSSMGQAMYQHAQRKLCTDAVQRHHDKILQKMAKRSPDASAVIAAPSPATHDVDAFFEEYPECMRENWMEEDSDDEEGNDGDEVQVLPAVENKAQRGAKKIKSGPQQQQVSSQHQQSKMGQKKPESGPQRPISARGRQSAVTGAANMPSAPNPPSSRSNNPYQNVSRSDPAARGRPGRPSGMTQAQEGSFQYTPPSQVDTVSNTWDNRSTLGSVPAMNYHQNNPYHHQQVQVRSQQPQHHQQAPGPSNPYGGRQVPSNNDHSWEDHRNQQNPFFTAREVAQGRAGDDVAPPPSRDHGAGMYGSASSHHPEDPHSSTTARGGGPNIPDSLRRKFQVPKRVSESDNKGNNSRSGRRPPSGVAPSNGGGVQCARPSSSGGKEEEDELPEELQHLDKELVKKIQNEIMESGETITFDDIAGLEDAKQTVQEVVCWPMKRPDLFTGLRQAPNGLLLYGPPGTGKTLIGKAIAHESGATFFSISSSSLTSKWIGEGEKLVKTLFAVAAYREPAVVFIDEIDSLLTQRKATENEASRRIKTEFLVQLDGTGTSGQGRVLVIGATNKPQELDEAARRRFTKRLYIPLPAEDDRRILLSVMLKKNNHVLTDEDIDRLAKDTSGFSGADLKSLCTDAAMGPIRQLGPRALDVDINDVPAITYKHFRRSLKGTKPSVAPSDLVQYEEWDQIYGSKRATEDDDDDE